MNLTSRYTHRPDVASEVIDGEAVIIDLATGVYYSLDHVGGRVWDLVSAGVACGGIIKAMTTEYEVDEARAREDLEKLIQQLRDENLLVVAEADQIAAEPPAPTGSDRAPYEAPKLVVYRDMGDLLALDPPTPGLSEIPWNTGGPRGEQKQ